MDKTTVHPVGIIMNGVTGRMGMNQHLMRSIVAIRKQGGVHISDREVIMPDMSGWSKKDALTFLTLIKAQFIIDGSGLVRSQSIAPGMLIDPDEVILVSLTP